MHVIYNCRAKVEYDSCRVSVCYSTLCFHCYSCFNDCLLQPLFALTLDLLTPCQTVFRDLLQIMKSKNKERITRFFHSSITVQSSV